MGDMGKQRESGKMGFKPFAQVTDAPHLPAVQDYVKYTFRETA